MIDPRIEGAKKRLKNIKRVIAVLSGKGGVGKTLFSTMLAIVLSERKIPVALLDLDFQGPTAHVVLGAGNEKIIEEKGIIPPVINGIRFMSLIYFLGDNPAPLRGKDRTNVLLELLAITNWMDSEILIIDMPPGSGDDVLDIIRFLDKKEFIIISTPSRLSIETVKRILELLTEQRMNVLGLVENMSNSTHLINLAKQFNINYLGNIPYDPEIEGALGDINALLKTNFARAVKAVSKKIF